MPTIHTIGHSTRPLEELVDLLNSFQVTHLVDIRTVPGSRHNPQYSERVLADELPGLGIDYRRMVALGGLRKTRQDSPNTGWRNASFRGYADYMQTPQFATAVEELAQLAQAHSVAIMCAEAVPWRCHRSMVGDALLVRGFDVLDIMGLGKATPHTLTRFAMVDGTTITYPPEQETP